MSSDKLPKTKSETFIFDDVTREPITMKDIPSMQTLKPKKYQNGHLSEVAIVRKEMIGLWVKQICKLSSMFSIYCRPAGSTNLSSSIYQRNLKIKEIKEKTMRFGKLISILKTN